MKMGPKINPKFDESGERRANCFRCQKEVKEKNMVIVSKSHTKNGWTGGDVLMICKSCHTKAGGE